MKAEFWHQRWQNNEIGFHRNEVNPNLIAHFGMLGLSEGDCVLVPLCGKSKDMLWLAEQGLHVIGVELSDKAAAAFFAENGLRPKKQRNGEMTCYRSDTLTLYCGDFFDLTPGLCQDVNAVYDRAALVALPEHMRTEYCAHLVKIVPEPLRGLLISFDYDQDRMTGPPFSVPADEIRRHFSDVVPVRPLGSRDILADEPQFKERGLDQMLEQVYFLGYPSR